MLSKPHIELKNIKHTAWASEETHCYQATLYVDGERWGTVSNQGHGGCDDFHSETKSWVDIQQLNALIGETFPTFDFGDGDALKQNLEMVCCDLVNQWLRDKEFNRAMKSKVLFTKPDSKAVWQVPVRKPQTYSRILDSMKAQNPTYTYLADLPLDEAKAIYFMEA